MSRALRVLVVYIIVTLVLLAAAFADDRPARAADQEPAIQEEVWAIPVTLPTIAYVVRPVGNGPFPLVIMNHGVSHNQRERSFFPLVEFSDAAMWFARRGYMVVAPDRFRIWREPPSMTPNAACSRVFFSKIGNCDNPNFRDAGRAVALLDKWIIEYMTDQKLIVPDNVIVVGQSAGGWAAIALSSRKPPRGPRDHHLRGRPRRARRRQAEQQLRARQLVEATGEFGRTARVPMLLDLHRERHVLRSRIIQANA